MKILNVVPETVRVSENKNFGEKLYDMGLGNDFLI
jgi:hypothetical protein